MLMPSYVGVDISKSSFHAAIAGKKKAKQFENSTKGFALFLQWLKDNTPTPKVCMEATGHYSEPLAQCLLEHEIHTSVVNPLQIKNFARACLARNKTDDLDAKIIATFAEKMNPKAYEPTPKAQKAMRNLVQFLDILKGQHTKLLNQKSSFQEGPVISEIKKSLASLKRQMHSVEKRIRALLEEESTLKASIGLLETINGIGWLSAVRLLAYLPNIHQFRNAKQVAAYAGVSPQIRQSGNYQGKSCLSKFGHSQLRQALYMPALTAKRSNKGLREFVERLEGRGLKPKAIVGAVMRKLIHIVYGMLKTQQPFNEALV